MLCKLFKSRFTLFKFKGFLSIVQLFIFRLKDSNGSSTFGFYGICSSSHFDNSLSFLLTVWAVLYTTFLALANMDGWRIGVLMSGTGSSSKLVCKLSWYIFFLIVRIFFYLINFWLKISWKFPDFAPKMVLIPYLRPSIVLVAVCQPLLKILIITIIIRRRISWHGIFPSCQEPEELSTSFFWWRPLIGVETSILGINLVVFDELFIYSYHSLCELQNPIRKQHTL